MPTKLPESSQVSSVQIVGDYGLICLQYEMNGTQFQLDFGQSNSTYLKNKQMFDRTGVAS